MLSLSKRDRCAEWITQIDCRQVVRHASTVEDVCAAGGAGINDLMSPNLGRRQPQSVTKYPIRDIGLSQQLTYRSVKVTYCAVVAGIPHAIERGTKMTRSKQTIVIA